MNERSGTINEEAKSPPDDQDYCNEVQKISHDFWF